MKIRIFGKVIEIYDEPINLENDYGELDGYFDPNTWKIAVDTKATNRFQSLLHEINHAIWFRTGMFQAGIPNQIHELICETFATAYDELFDDLIKIRRKYRKK